MAEDSYFRRARLRDRRDRGAGPRVRQWRLRRQQLRSPHRFGLAEAVETAWALGALPQSLTVYGIEGQEFGAGTALSEPVARAAERLVALLADAPGTGN
ncbi:hypothetical protein HTY61_01930 [Oricola thermophila]|uniref:Hydrogenase maturation protease n=1 Tax=Oricola thermophila TaxID=2742145 RepID=A0A6N1VE37_9HYPH|nr:hypothetical protein HTY61_01930 [Oricola thermophila]